MRTIRLLGTGSIVEAGSPMPGRTVQRSRMALLALLALSRTRSRSRENLMALLWPESDTERARHLLRESLYRLRDTLGDDALVASGDEIRLDSAGVDCDVWAFESAIARGDWEEADRLYVGPLLDGVFLTEVPDFERWADAERSRLADAHARALESLATARGARGDRLGAVDLWRRCAAADPENARVTLRLMEALDLAGDRAGALRQAATHASVLRSEHGAGPDPAVAAFAERLRRDTTRREISSARDVAATTSGDVDENSSQDAPRATPRQAAGRTSRRRMTYGVLTAFAGVAVLGAGLTNVRSRTPRVVTNRIAILPFRISGADPALATLHAGLVELLTLEFNGDVGPAAVEAGEVLRAWRGAGDGTESTTPSLALRVAKELGAGEVAFGAVVGTARRFTVSVSVLNVADAAVRIPPVRVEGSIDSLPVLVAELAAKLLARSAGTWRLSVNDPEQTSAEVLRAYLRGMVEYRQAHWVQAGRQLFHALELDSTFVPAAYRFALIHAITAPTTPLGDPPARDPRLRRLYRVLWNGRQRLSGEQRLLLEAVADSHYVLWRMQALPRLERAVTLLPGSVEAWDILGDDYFHAGAFVGREDWPERAKVSLLRARELDSAIAVAARMHLPDLAFIAHDLRAHARYGVANTGPRGPHYLAYQAAILRGEPDAIHSARIRYSSAWARGEEDGLDWTFQGLTLPQLELDSLIHQFQTDSNTDEQRRFVAGWLISASMLGGRPAAAAEARRRYFALDTIAEYEVILDHAVDDSVAAERLARTTVVLDSAVNAKQKHPVACSIGLSRLRRGDSTGVAAIIASEPVVNDSRSAIQVMSTMRRGLVGQAALCGQVLRGVSASLFPASTSSDRTLLLRADSMMRFTSLNYADLWNYDLALAFARRGEYGAAAATVRRHFVGLDPLPRLVIGLRQEGHWAALAGDTAAAVRAYRHYLLWRQAPEPALIPQRDSVRAELALLEKRSRLIATVPWMRRTMRLLP